MTTITRTGAALLALAFFLAACGGDDAPVADLTATTEPAEDEEPTVPPAPPVGPAPPDEAVEEVLVEVVSVALLSPPQAVPTASAQSANSPSPRERIPRHITRPP